MHMKNQEKNQALLNAMNVVNVEYWNTLSYRVWDANAVTQ